MKQVDFNGEYSFSDIVLVHLNIVYAFSLEQNYPNPFNPSTIIKYSVPTAGYVSIKIYDAIGQLVSTLLNESKEPGEY